MVDDTSAHVVADGVVGADALRPGDVLGGGVSPQSSVWSGDALPRSLECDGTPPPALEVHEHDARRSLIQSSVMLLSLLL